MSHIVVVQHIHTYWTKAARGGKRAAKRNSVPEVCLIPMQRIKTAGLVALQHDLLYHGSHLTPDENIHMNPAFRPLKMDCIRVDWGQDMVFVSFRYDMRGGGRPDRGWTSKSFHIVEGEWAQMMHNGRFTGFDYGSHDDGNWYYEKVVVNVGLFERLSDDLFTHSEPNYRFSAIEHLF